MGFFVKAEIFSSYILLLFFIFKSEVLIDVYYRIKQNSLLMAKKTKNLQGLVVLKSFLLTKKITSGSYGVVYKALNSQQPTGVFYAVKAQSRKADLPQIIFEFKLYRLIHKNEQTIGFPKIYGASIQKSCNFLLMQHLGKNLEQLLVSFGGKFSLKTVIMIGIQTIERLEFLHEKGFIHRDLKPQNLLIGYGKKARIIHLIDLGLCKRYFNYEKGHIIQNFQKGLILGTPRFNSKNGNRGITQSRKDDLQSLCYILVYMMKGNLPWDSQDKQKTVSYEDILNKKENTSTSSLCDGLPNQIKEFTEKVQNLKFSQNPDYQKLKQILSNMAINNNIELDDYFDWSPKLFDFLKE